MEKYALILTAGLITYATRLAGLLLGRFTVPPTIERFLAYVPVAVFAALITPDLGVGTKGLLPRLAGVIAAGLVVLRYRQLWAGLGVGMGVYWLMTGLPL
jgi:branched-subunit amino acid transport protein